MNFYVWYRVEKDDQDTETAVRGMMARLACRTGISGQLFKKRDEPRLWMEVYADVADPGAFERLMNQKADEYDLGMFIDGNRRVEAFLTLGSATPACTPHP